MAQSIMMLLSISARVFQVVASKSMTNPQTEKPITDTIV
jgi:hypothetical protein